MKHPIVYAILLILTQTPALAEKHPTPAASAPATPTPVAPAASSHSHSGNPDKSFGLGVASFGGSGGGTSITGWIPLQDRAGVQVFLGIPNTAVNFNFSAGGAYKLTTHGTSSNGFHIGGNVLMGSTGGNFTVQPGGLVGIHFTPAHSMLLAFDGGPQLTITDGEADFSLDAFSAQLGASLIYFF
jgi:hypothetical protein